MSPPCLTCGISLESYELQKEHYKTDWHRYNLNRKVASLPPLSLAEYNARTAQNMASSAIHDAACKRVSCQYCNCTFASAKGLENHLASGKHGDIIDQLPQTPFEDAVKLAMDACSITEVDELFEKDPQVFDKVLADLRIKFPEKISPVSCLFCKEGFGDIQSNLNHMVDIHSFFIPDVENLTDLEEKRYRSVEALRMHMLDKGHTMVGDDLSELFQFYNYETMDDDEFEDIEEDMAGSHDQLISLDHSHNADEGDEYELELFSGKKIGHRRYRRYYSQNLPDSDEEKDESLSRGRALVKAREPAPVILTPQEKKDQRKFVRLLSRKMMKLGVKHNLFQPHYREQIL